MITPSRAPDLLSPGRHGLLAAGRPGEGLEWRIERCLGDVVHIFGDQLHRDIQNDAKHRGIAPACALERGDIGVTDKAAQRDDPGGEHAQRCKPRVRNRAALPHRSNHRVIERLAFGNGSVRGQTEVAFVLDAGRNLDDLQLQRIDFSTAC
jgi:hypothetical protein